MGKKAIRFLAVCLAAVLAVSVMTAAAAETESITIKAEGLELLYKEKGFSGMTGTETERATTAIMAAFDLLSYDKNASILDNYIFIGLDKEKPDYLMYIGFGGKESSYMILYAPQNQSGYAYLVPVAMKANWIETFMGPFCGKQYWQVSPTVMKTLLKK